MSETNMRSHRIAASCVLIVGRNDLAESIDFIWVREFTSLLAVSDRDCETLPALGSFVAHLGHLELFRAHTSSSILLKVCWNGDATVVMTSNSDKPL